MAAKTALAVAGAVIRWPRMKSCWQTAAALLVVVLPHRGAQAETSESRPGIADQRAQDQAPPASPLAPKVQGDCPTQNLVATTLAGTLPPPHTTDETRALILVVDEGKRYKVVAGAETRTYSDPLRNCEERARTAAIFATLALRPPVVFAASQGAPPTLQPPAVASASATTRPASGTAFRLGAGMLLENAMASTWAVGAEVRLSWDVANQMWGAFVAAGARTATSLSLAEGAGARLQRFPLDLGLRGQTLGPTRFVAELGLLASLLTLRGEGSLQTPLRANRMAFGLRAAAGACRAAAGMRICLTPTVAYLPRRYRLTTLDGTALGETPGAFWGLTLSGDHSL